MGDITVRDFGVDKDSGKKVELYSLYNKEGKLVAEIMTYGATILSLYAPGPRTDSFHDVIVGYDNLLPFFDPNPYYGATVGRVCNRITEGKFKLNDKDYQLNTTPGGWAAHGGPEGFHKKVFDAKIVTDEKTNHKKLVMTYVSPDGDEKYPGELHLTATFAVEENDKDEKDKKTCLSVTYKAKLADKEKQSTILNVTNHAYWNLAGNEPEVFDPNNKHPHHNIYNHRLAMRSSHYLRTPDTCIPTGEFRSCAEDPIMDFGKDFFSKCADIIPFGSVSIPSIINSYSNPSEFGRRFGDEIENESFDQIKYGKGYDNTWALNKGKGIPYITAEIEKTMKKIEEPILAAIATCEKLGKEHDINRYLAVYTTQPGLGLYTGNWIGDDMGKKNDENQPHLENRKGPGYPERAGFALEAQHYPDSINKPTFPSIVLKPGEVFEHKTIFEVGNF